jgi:transposase InsO family protein
VYLQEYDDGEEALGSLKRYWRFYNRARPHQSLAYCTPAAVYFGEELTREARPQRVVARV